MMFQERLPEQLPPGSGEVRVGELLSQPPGQTLAVVPSARMNWRRYLIGEDPALSRDEDHFNEEVVTTLVGLLNAQGGHLVVGALTTDARFGPSRAGDHPLLKDYPSEGRYLVIGLEAEDDPYEWDQFRQWLISTIRLRIEPAPIGTVGVTKHKIHGRELCVIKVAPTSATWYYRRVKRGEDPVFLVREDARTVRQGGLSADIYKQARPRG
jgi:predicted HTH transcriptional regulator